MAITVLPLPAGAHKTPVRRASISPTARSWAALLGRAQGHALVEGYRLRDDGLVGDGVADTMLLAQRPYDVTGPARHDEGPVVRLAVVGQRGLKIPRTAAVLLGLAVGRVLDGQRHADGPT